MHKHFIKKLNRYNQSTNKQPKTCSALLLQCLSELNAHAQD